MKTIPKQTLSAAIAAVVGVGSGAKDEGAKKTASIATITCDANSLSIKCHNMNEWLSTTIDAPGDMADIQVEVAALKDAVLGMRGETLKLSVEDGSLILSGKGRRKISGVVTEYPKPPPVSGSSVTFNLDHLKRCVAFVKANVSDNSSLMNGALRGVHFHAVDGTLKAVSVDGNSCACIDVQPCQEAVDATLGKSALALIEPITDETVTATFGENLVSIKWSSGEIVAKRVSGEFAKYQKLIPAHDLSLYIAAEEFRKGLAAIQSVSAFDTNLNSARTTIELGAQRDPETGDLLDGMDAGLIGQAQGKAGNEPLDCEWTGPDAKIAFASRVLLNVLSGFVGELEVGITPFKVGERPTPILIRERGNSDRFAFVMPLISAI